MSAPVSLVRLSPDMQALSRWGVSRGYLPRGVDFGYAVHAGLKAVLGNLAPRPFVLRDRREGIELLGYTAASPQTILESAAAPAVNDAEAALAVGLAGLEARAMPERWSLASRWSFEVRARPVVRSRPDGRQSKHQEIDVAMWARQRHPESAARTKEELYVEWLRDTLMRRKAAGLRVARVIGMRSALVLRRPRRGEERSEVRVPGPDVLFRGELEVTDSDAFPALLTTGVGRHRAFGFGCLLLAPPGAL